MKTYLVFSGIGIAFNAPYLNRNRSIKARILHFPIHFIFSINITTDLVHLHTSLPDFLCVQIVETFIFSIAV